MDIIWGPEEHAQPHTLSFSPLHAGSRPGAYAYTGPRGYQLVGGAWDSRAEGASLPTVAVRFLLSPLHPTDGRAVIQRGGRQLACGGTFTAQPKEGKEGKGQGIVWCESTFERTVRVEDGDSVLLEMDTLATCMFVYAEARSGPRDLGTTGEKMHPETHGVRIRPVDGLAGKDNRYNMYMELVLTLPPAHAHE
jgi:hypothetical protein